MSHYNFELDLDNITFILYDKTYWKYGVQTENQYKVFPFENINEFLFDYKHFIQISSKVIVNVGAISVFIESQRLVIINSTKFSINKRFLPFFKLSYFVFHSKYLYNLQLKSEEFLTISKYNMMMFQHADYSSIKYLIRENTSTKIFFNDGTVKYFYETLKYVQFILKDETSFIRINRNTIINLNYLCACQIDREKKIGMINIDTRSFTISRRELSNFINHGLNILK